MKARVPILLVGVAIAIVVVGKMAVQASVSRLEVFEEQAVQRHTANGVLANTRKRDAVLDEVEEFLIQNKGTLLVSDYERTPNSIHVTFLFWFYHVFQPRVEGIG